MVHHQHQSFGSSLPHHRLVVYRKALELLAAVRAAQVRDAKLRDEALRAAKGCCLNIADGKRVWKEGRYGRGQVMLLRDQGLLLVSSESGELVLLAADPAAHRELGRFQALSSKTWNHPVVRGDRVYLRSAEEMACYSFSTKPATALN